MVVLYAFDEGLADLGDLEGTSDRILLFGTFVHRLNGRLLNRLFDRRLELMLSTDDPLFPNWNQDETAVAGRYQEQDPAKVDAALGREFAGDGSA